MIITELKIVTKISKSVAGLLSAIHDMRQYYFYYNILTYVSKPTDRIIVHLFFKCWERKKNK